MKYTNCPRCHGKQKLSMYPDEKTCKLYYETHRREHPWKGQNHSPPCPNCQTDGWVKWVRRMFNLSLFGAVGATIYFLMNNEMVQRAISFWMGV